MNVITTAKEIIELAFMINTIVDNYPKFKKIYKFTDTNITKPLIEYLSTCHCSVCVYNRSNNLKPIH